MPAKVLKDLHLFENTDQLQLAVGSELNATKLGYKKLLATAEKLFDEAKLKESDGDEELAYVYYMRSFKTFHASRKACDYSDQRDRIHWQEMGGKRMPVALRKAEDIFQSLRRRYELKRDLEEADLVAATTSNQNPEASANSQPANSKEPGANSKRADLEDCVSSGEADRSITPYDLYRVLQKSQPSVLILDTRDRREYGRSHIRSPHCINIPIEEFSECYTATQFEQQLPVGDRACLRLRHNYDYIVLVDGRSADAEAALAAGQPLRVLSAAICEFDNRPVQRPPSLLVGGFESWFVRYPSLCTNAASYEPATSEYDYGPAGIGERYVREQWSYPDFSSIIEQLGPSESTQPPSIPLIPDRKTKPTFKSSVSGVDGLVDVGDYVQLRIPQPFTSPNSDVTRNEEDVQAVFDKAVSAHIDLRERLDSIGEKFRAVHTDTEDKEPIGPASPLPDKNTKPIDMQEPEAESENVQLMDKNEVVEENMEERSESVQPNVPDRSTKPNFHRTEDYANPRNGTTPSANSTNDCSQEKRNDPPAPQRAQVPDRSTKPSNNPRDFDAKRMEQLELEFYTNAVRRTGGLDGRVAPGLTGLKNLGNSCYMNSTVQCLSNIQPFTSYFVRGMYRNDINYYNQLGSKGEVARNYAALLGALWEGRLKYIFPYQFKQCIGKVAPVFAGYDQQDSQEFLVFLLDGLHEDLNVVKERRPIPEQNNDGLNDEEAAHRAWLSHVKVNSSIIVNMFQGQYLSVVKCRTCLRESRTFDVFMYLSLPIPSDRKCRLEDCLQKFLAPENMTGDCKWFCPHCQRKRDAVKKISIWKLPKVLLIHLKRFSYTERWREKLQTNVDFPTNRFDVSQYCRTPASYYTLVGVSNHYGTMESGHYTAYCKNALDGRWYKFDDHDVSPISQGAVKTPAAYILYYMADDRIAEQHR